MSNERPTNPEALRPSGSAPRTTVPTTGIPRDPRVPKFGEDAELQALLDAVAERAAKRTADYFIEDSAIHRKKVEGYLQEHRREALARLRADEAREQRFDVFCAEVRGELAAIKAQLEAGRERFEAIEGSVARERERSRRLLETVSALKLLSDRRPLGSSGPLGGVAVLCVEDDPDVQHALLVTLTDAGAECHFADTVEAARSLLEANPFDVAIVDLLLRGGDDGMRIVRELCLGGGAGVVVASGNVDAAVREELRELGVVAVLHKPYGGAALVSAILEARDARGPA